MKQFVIIARYTFLEAIRNRLFAIMLVSLIAVFGLVEFVGELAITETRHVQAGLSALILRLFAVFITVLFVITSMVREFNDKTLDVLLSTTVSRMTYCLAKLAGYTVLSACVVLLTSIVMLVYSEPGQLLVWSISLWCELIIVVSLSLFFLFTFGNITTSFTAVAAFYLLARSMDSLRLISQSPLLESASPAQGLINSLIEGLAYVLPGLDDFVRTEWLVYGTVQPADLLPVVLQTVVYTVLIASAALFDFYRKNF